MVTVHVAQQYGVYLTEARIVGPSHRPADIVEQTCAVGVLEDERAVESAELALMATEGGDLYGGPRGRVGGSAGRQADGMRSQRPSLVDSSLAAGSWRALSIVDKA